MYASRRLSCPSFFHPSTNRRMYRLLSNGLIGEPCGLPRPSSRFRVLRCLFPRSGRSTRTAHEPSEPLGWAEIRHPFHPLRGQSFPVLKTRRLAGVDTLVLRGLERGTFSVAREWTDWADPDPYSALGLPPRRCDLDLLLDLANLLEQ